MVRKEIQKNNIVIYTPKNGSVDLDVRVENESVWLTQTQIADLYEKERTVITKHINNIFKDKEIDEKSNVQKMHIAKSDKPVSLYSLDIVLAIGYRTNSAVAIKFRKWATSVLKRYLLDGYILNERRLRQTQENFQTLQSTIQFLSSKIASKNLKGQEKEIFSLLSDYSKTLSVLDQYDRNVLATAKGKKSSFVLTYEKMVNILARVRTELIAKQEATELFAQERGGAFAGIIGSLYQTFGGNELYTSVEEKAAHLLYFTIKDHPFSDGNKRSAAFLFVYFLDKNKHLYKKSGEKKINDNALAALALLVAESDPKEKDLMIKLIINLIGE
ncbi:MAG: virulence protein RhuM/Fic/DOC family protein [Candidatus Moraniibacteriota bacterium]